MLVAVLSALLVLLTLNPAGSALAGPGPCDAPSGGTCDASGSGGTSAAGGGGATCDAPSGGMCDLQGTTSAAGGTGNGGGPRFNFGSGGVAPPATAVVGNIPFTG